jgi:hypothetical protein
MDSDCLAPGTPDVSVRAPRAQSGDVTPEPTGHADPSVPWDLLLDMTLLDLDWDAYHESVRRKRRAAAAAPAAATGARARAPARGPPPPHSS